MVITDVSRRRAAFHLQVSNLMKRGTPGRLYTINDGKKAYTWPEIVDIYNRADFPRSGP
jgi:hypothetical protein